MATSAKVSTTPIRLAVSRGEVYAYWEKPIPKLVQWSFLLFGATIPLDGLNLPLLASQGVSLPAFFGFLFFLSYVAQSGLPFRLSFPPIPSALWWFLVYLMTFIAAGLLAGDAEAAGIRAYVNRVLRVVQQIALFWFAADLLRDGSFARKYFVVIVSVCALVGTGALLGLPGFATELYQDRASAFEASPNDVGPLMAYAAILGIGLYLSNTGWSGKRKLFLLGLTLPVLGLMVASGSRGAMGAFILGMLFFFVPHRGSKRMMLAFSVGVAVIVAVVYLALHDAVTAQRWSETISEGESAGRWPIYATAWQMFQEKPLLGWGGLAAFDELGMRLGLQRARDAHNFALYLLIEVGLIGAIPFMIAIWLSVKAAWKARVYQFGLMPISLMVAVLSYNMTHTAIKGKLFWLILGLAFAASSAGRERQGGRVTAFSNTRSREPKATQLLGKSIS